MIGCFVTMDVIVLRDNVHKTMVKENDSGGWSSNDVMLQLEDAK
jgi:hypothetical protein